MKWMSHHSCDADSAQPRDRELADALDAVKRRIQRACVTADRDPSQVRLIAVTKNFPAADVIALARLGVTDFAENRDQEAVLKTAAVTAELNIPLRWHFVGRLQRNKVRSVVRWADQVHSVDSDRLVLALEHAVAQARAQGDRDHPLDVFVQLSLDSDPTRGGCSIDELPRLAERIAQSGELTLRGVMAVAPLTIESAAAYTIVAEVAAELRVNYPFATELSTGMSADLEAAIAHGSTCVRVGTALLGVRRLASQESP